MKIVHCTVLAGLALTLAVSGCKKEEVKRITAEQIPAELEGAFKEAPPEANAAAQEIITAVRDENPQALMELQSLASRSDVTDEQRAAANRAQAALHQQLLEAAARGDKKAEDALNQYRATK